MKTTALFATILTATLCISCVSSGSKGSSTAHVQVLSSGDIRVDGKSVAVNHVGKTLKRSGYTSQSTVNIQVPEDVSDRVLKAVTVSLTNNGFRRVIFIKPQQAKVDIVTPEQKKQSPK